MKKSLLSLGLAGLIVPATAQYHQASSFNKSVFRNASVAPVVAKPSVSMLQKLQSSLPGWQLNMNTRVGQIRDMFGPAASIAGSTIADKAAFCFDNFLSATGLNKSEWLQVRNQAAPHAQYIDFQQSFNGHNVAFTNVSFRFTTDGKLVRMKVKEYGRPDINLAPVVSKQEALVTAAQGLTGANISSQQITGDWVWFPVPTAKGYELHPAWAFAISGTTESQFPIELTGYVDATDGSLLYRSNSVRENLDLKVKGTVYKNGTTQPTSDEPLANLQITIGGSSVYSDTAGYVNNAIANAPGSATLPLQGRWSKVSTNGTVPSFSTSIAANGTIYMYPATSPSSSRHVNAYYHVNRVHDFLKSYLPNFTGMDIQLPTKVDVASTSGCNAFYDGSSINFYAANSFCYSFAEIGDVIYHEYGHGISHKFYSTMGAGNLQNGALDEANSDIWALSITRNPILGQNAYTPAAGMGTANYIRRYDQNPKVYPRDIQGEVHADGEIVAGAWWDVGVNIGSIDSMTKLFTETYFDLPDGPDGTEGEVYHDVLMSALMNDDDDNNLNNGTPHFIAIVRAFAKHGIYLMNDLVVNHTEVAHQPANQPIDVQAQVTSTYMPFFQGIEVRYRLRGATAWDTVAMVSGGGNSYTAQIPGQPEGTLIDYYFAVKDLSTDYNGYAPTDYNPTWTANQSTIPYQFGVGISSRVTNDFENVDPNWKIGNNTSDNATKGKWIQAVPVASYVSSQPCQMGADHTTGTGKCLVTGNAASTSLAASTAAVVQGTTTVLSPILDLTGYAQPIIEYYRWYSNDRGQSPRKDQWIVSVKDSAGVLWKNVEQTYQSDYNWRRRIFAVKEFLPSSKKVQIKFTATSGSSNTSTDPRIIEAGVDDFYIYDKNAPAGVSGSPVVEKAIIFPNPADDQLNISMLKNASGDIRLYDMTGKMLFTTQLTAGKTDYSISTKQLAAGQYMLMITGDKTIQCQKVVVTH